METTDRPTAHAIAVVRRIDAAIVVEVQVVRVDAVRRGRPIDTVVTDIIEAATAVAAETRSRIPNSLVGTELTGKVHAFVDTIIKRAFFEI